ncbi:hypothetical protein HON22_05115 [Candidatus Peregrinibacteria bacterium]|nr:hypothetical protein [Candidatus Peregrinibacteria bacterium]
MKKILITFLGLLLQGNIAFAEARADVSLILKNESQNDSVVLVSIYIENPSKQQIASVQSWLKYDPQVLKGKKIDASASPFDFVAPGENSFDDTQGQLKIGRSSITGGSNEEKILVAEVAFEWLKKQNTTLSFYNFQLDNSGNTNVMVFQEGFPVNILKEGPKALEISASGVVIPASNLGNSEGNETSNQPVTDNDSNTELLENEVAFETLRPSDLRITSGPEYVILSWESMEEIQGYNLYYSNVSGRYLQRRTVGNVEEYYLDKLETGKDYYFALTAYDNTNKETDYSDEVRIRVGYPDSSTSPLRVTKSEKILKNSKRHVNSGPATLLLLSFGLAVLGGVLVRRKARV